MKSHLLNILVEVRKRLHSVHHNNGEIHGNILITQKYLNDLIEFIKSKYY